MPEHAASTSLQSSGTIPPSAPPIGLDWDAKVSLKHLAESMPIAVVIVNDRGHIVYVNAKSEEMFGYNLGEMLGKAVEILIPERFRHQHTLHRKGYMHHPHVRSMGSGIDLAGKRKDGSEFPLEAGLSALPLEGETFVVVTVTDISKRKEVEEMLARQVEERTHEVERREVNAEGLREILSTLIANQSLPDLLSFIAAESTRLLTAAGCLIYSRHEQSGLLQRQIAYSAAEDAPAPGIAAKGGGDPEFAQSHAGSNQAHLIQLEREAALTEALAHPEPLYDGPMIFTDFGGDASVLPTYLTVPIRDRQKIYGIFLIYYTRPHRVVDQEIELALRVADLTVLAFANAHLRAQIELSAVTAERSRIARDLHDAVTQTLFSASIIAGVLPTIWQRNQAEGERRLDELRDLTRGALAEMRTLLLELRPAKLTEVKLADLLRQLAEAISGRARIPVSVQISGTQEIAVDVKVAFYRVAQEALNNIAKHAHATHVWIELEATPYDVALSVRDDGIGFVFDHIAPHHLGLGIMQERTDAIGASLTIDSLTDSGTTGSGTTGSGTTISVRWTSEEDTISDD